MTSNVFRLGHTVISVCIFALTFPAPLASQTADLPLFVNDDGLPTLAPLLADVTPAVVSISIESRDAVQMSPLFNDPFFQNFFDLEPFQQQPQLRQQLSTGSGVIIDANKGYILTNHHVLENGDRIIITLKDSRKFDAKLVGSDPATDIALIEIDANDLSALEMGDSDRLQVGDYVVAIGNPFGLGQTVTSGIVSALGRSGINIEGYEDFIQTDAAINPGNSGGALITLDGRVAGINTAIIAPSGGNVGIGFAVPANMAMAVINQLIEFGEVQRGQLGVTIQDFTPDIAEALGIEAGPGVVVTQVMPGTAAEEAGLQAGDIIVSLDRRNVAGSADLRNQIGQKRLGRKIEIGIIRDGRKMTLSAILRNEAQSAVQSGEREDGWLSGAELRNLAPGDPLYGEVSGVVVLQLDPDSRAAWSGLDAGDIIVAVNRVPVSSLAELREELRKSEQTVALTIRRGSARIFLIMR